MTGSKWGKSVQILRYSLRIRNALERDSERSEESISFFLEMGVILNRKRNKQFSNEEGEFRDSSGKLKSDTKKIIEKYFTPAGGYAFNDSISYKYFTPSRGFLWKNMSRAYAISH